MRTFPTPGRSTHGGPARQYVNWVGIDGYYYRPSDTFSRVFGATIDQVREFTDKPVLLSETAVGPRAGQLAKITNLFAGMRQYNTLGLVWFDMAQHDGIYHQDWRIQDNPAAESAFRLGVRDELTPAGSQLALIIRAASGLGRVGVGLANSVNVLLAGVVNSTFSYAVSRCASDRHVM